MKKYIVIVLILSLGISTTSCGTASKAIQKNKTEVAGYTLKNKTQLMKQKILHKKYKTVIATP